MHLGYKTRWEVRFAVAQYRPKLYHRLVPLFSNFTPPPPPPPPPPQPLFCRAKQKGRILTDNDPEKTNTPVLLSGSDVIFEISNFV